MYDPTVGRWLNLDPIGFAGTDANTARYVANRPTNATDPTGLQERGYQPAPINHGYDGSVRRGSTSLTWPLRTADLNIVILQNDSKNGNRQMTEKLVREWVKAVNTYWAQAGIQFRIKSVKVLTDEQTLSLLGGKSHSLQATDVLPKVAKDPNRDRNAITVYFAQLIQGRSRGLGATMCPEGIVALGYSNVAGSDEVTMAHELGHALGLRDREWAISGYFSLMGPEQQLLSAHALSDEEIRNARKSVFFNPPPGITPLPR